MGAGSSSEAKPESQEQHEVVLVPANVSLSSQVEALYSDNKWHTAMVLSIAANRQSAVVRYDLDRKDLLEVPGSGIRLLGRKRRRH